jgi:hypothetical protein
LSTTKKKERRWQNELSGVKNQNSSIQRESGFERITEKAM